VLWLPCAAYINGYGLEVWRCTLPLSLSSSLPYLFRCFVPVSKRALCSPYHHFYVKAFASVDRSRRLFRSVTSLWYSPHLQYWRVTNHNRHHEHQRKNTQYNSQPIILKRPDLTNPRLPSKAAASQSPSPKPPTPTPHSTTQTYVFPS
jgi:hypothetical protein